MIMKFRKIFEIVTRLENIADAQDTCIHEILDALVGVCFDEEEAGDIKHYIEKRQKDFERRRNLGLYMTPRLQARQKINKNSRGE